MKQKIPCLCENSFEVDYPEEINLDSDPHYLDEILDGSFFNFICPSCSKKHKPEFPILVLWPSKKACFEVVSELDRGEFYRAKKPPAQKDSLPIETIISYPEMADRLAVIRDGFEPTAVEAIKYHLLIKAEEQYPENEMEIWYYSSNRDGPNGFLEFHIHGIRENEVAVTKIPLSLYQKTLDDYTTNPKGEIFAALRVRSYLSVKNTMRSESLM